MLAMLFVRSQGRITREEYMRMHDWELVNAYCRPDANERRPENGYWPVARIGHIDSTPSTPEKMFYEVWRKRGMKDEEIKERYLVWLGEKGKALRHKQSGAPTKTVRAPRRRR